MSASALPWALGMLIGGGTVAIVYGERSDRGMSRPRSRSGGGEGDREGDREAGGEGAASARRLRKPGAEGERGGIRGGRTWSLVVLVSVLIVATMLGVGAELLVGAFRKRLPAPA